MNKQLIYKPFKFTFMNITVEQYQAAIQSAFEYAYAKGFEKGSENIKELVSEAFSADDMEWLGLIINQDYVLDVKGSQKSIDNEYAKYLCTMPIAQDEEEDDEDVPCYIYGLNF
jgi:hypothetical protein